MSVGNRFIRSIDKFKAGPPPRPNKLWTTSIKRDNRTTYFDNSTEVNVTVQLGKSAYLDCKVHNIEDKTISWVRQVDWHILTVGTYTYTRDVRFRSIRHNDNNNHWTLEMKFTTMKDSGVYECQVSSEPKINRKIMLTVVVATAKIEGSPALYVKTGSTINLKCMVMDSTQPPIYVFWYHNGEVINYDSPKHLISVETKRHHSVKNSTLRTVSELTIFNAKHTDSGNYTCRPSYTFPDTITVHVLIGEKRAAMQHDRSLQSSINHYCHLLCYAITSIIIYLMGNDDVIVS
ncbi:Uncharacterised protein g787 [Pycnogonum litorale]